MTWTRGPTIGRGSSAVVSLATGADGDIFAVKSADLSSSAFLRREETLISHLCSPHVVKCLGSDTTRENDRHIFNLFLEYVPGGTLSDQIRKRGGALDETAIRSYGRQILLGLSYLHQQGMAHCDIKGQNILVGDAGLKIADFGCARWAAHGGPGAFSGTPAYMAPEVARGEEQGLAADVWAFGCTVVEMATGSGPWPEMKDPAAALYRIAFSGDLPETPDGLSDAAGDMLARCLTRDPRERWTAAQLLQHPFFDSVEEEEIECREIQELIRKSPTSVMDQGIWDSLEDSQFSETPAEIELNLISPADRVRALVGGHFPASLAFSGWADGEDWITVRGNEVQNSEDLFQNSSENSIQNSEDLAVEEVVTVVEQTDLVKIFKSLFI
ncbi:mitogen-activated protein kinase kinase kinase 15 [Striga hermonthica]|uniref:Mitogen-activated protein kinase kinase kinase 15 n=1 Tax=Striga hermonthica TaxID=68872 RepID=A0A9N7R640_STRHE|nr:mitogen-activated protein kinase kinase kinase 15 [Striga hermonthica]